MRKHLTKLSLLGSALALAALGSATVFALPSQANVHAQAADTHTSATAGQPTTPGDSSMANGQAHMQAGQLRACQNREKAINNIMTRIDTRAQNQLTLFGTIATRVESFYTAKSKTVSNYDQLVAAIASAKAQAETDFGTMQSNSTFSCTANNPKGMVTSFQNNLKTEISDLKAYKTSVKNLIVAVASANGVTISSSNQASTTGGQ